MYFDISYETNQSIIEQNKLFCCSCSYIRIKALHQNVGLNYKHDFLLKLYMLIFKRIKTVFGASLA